MENLICSYSSDARTLYKADIYKVLSMPKGFIVHFRYKLKYVDTNILSKLDTFINNDVVIFYTLTKNLKNEKNIPIRKAKLVRAEVSTETSLFHAYMELGDFTNVEPQEGKPSDKFFTSQKLEFKNQNNDWIDKIEQVKESFDDMLFYYVKSITDYNGKNIRIKQRKDKKASLYELKHGRKYMIELSIGNPKETNSKLQFNTSSDDVTANIPKVIEITAQYDDISVPIYIKSLNVSNDSSFISFNPLNQNESINTEYNFNIEIAKGIGWLKPLGFGILTLLTLLGFVLVKDSNDSINHIFSCNLQVDISLIIGIILMTFCSSFLFYFFNKK